MHAIILIAATFSSWKNGPLAQSNCYHKSTDNHARVAAAPIHGPGKATCRSLVALKFSNQRIRATPLSSRIERSNEKERGKISWEQNMEESPSNTLLYFAIHGKEICCYNDFLRLIVPRPFIICPLCPPLRWNLLPKDQAFGGGLIRINEVNMPPKPQNTLFSVFFWCHICTIPTHRWTDAGKRKITKKEI